MSLSDFLPGISVETFIETVNISYFKNKLSKPGTVTESCTSVSCE